MTHVPCQEQVEHRHPDSSWVAPAIIAGILGAWALSQSRGQKAEKPPSVNDLLKNGPKVITSYPVNTFPIYGLVGDGWPITLDYSAAPDAETVFTVTIGERTWSQRLEPGAHKIQMRYEGGDAPKTSAALFTVTSVAHTQSGDEPRAVNVYGITAGERAALSEPAEGLLSAPDVQQRAVQTTGPAAKVYRLSTDEQTGSEPIEDLTFGPSVLEGGKQSAQFSYLRRETFDHVAAEILHTASSYDQKAKTLVTHTAIVWRQEVGHVQTNGRSEGVWDGRDEKRNLSRGVHRLQVRGWHSRSPAPWVWEESPQSVEVR